MYTYKLRQGKIPQNQFIVKGSQRGLLVKKLSVKQLLRKTTQQVNRSEDLVEMGEKIFEQTNQASSCLLYTSRCV